MQSELKTVREFRKRRAEMQQQLEQLQSSLEASEHQHKTSLSNMEHRYSLSLFLSFFFSPSFYLSLSITTVAVCLGSLRRSFDCRKKPTGELLSWQKRHMQKLSGILVEIFAGHCLPENILC